MAITLFGSAHVPAIENDPNAGPTATVTPPADMVSGHYVTVVATYRNTANDITITTTGGQTWTSHTQVNQTQCRSRVFSCVFNGTWDADPVFDSVQTQPLMAVMHVWAGVDTTDPLDVAVAGDVYAAPASIPGDVTIPEITTATDGAVAVFVAASADNNSWGASTVGWDVVGEAYWRNSAGSDQSQAWAMKAMPTAGATGALVTQQLTALASAGAYHTFALKPAGASEDAEKRSHDMNLTVNGVQLEPFASETITVSTAVKTLTAATYKPAGQMAAWAAYMTTATDTLRYFVDGSVPTSSVGHQVASGDPITITGGRALSKFQCIRSGASDVPLTVTYFRPGP